MPARFARFAVLVAIALSAPATASANDSTAVLAAGGLQLVRNDDVELLSEDLHISAEAVTVAYRFRNKTAAPVTYVVAFPLPAIDAVVPEALNIVLPDGGAANFIDFRVTVDGAAVSPSLDERATALGIDRTADLKRYGLPLNPIADGLYETLQAMPAADLAELNRVGLVYIDPYARQAAWNLAMTYYWEQTFPAGREVAVEHRYRPVVGQGLFGDFTLKDAAYRTRYCIDSDFERAARAKLAAATRGPNPQPYLSERRISYILTTANNWASAIGRFRLVVDKGGPDALVSFCGTGVRKISPTEFEVTATDFVPDRDLDILVVLPVGQ